MKLNLIGTIFGTTGYDSHTRQLFNALYELNSDIRLDVPRPPEWEQLVNDAELNALSKSTNKDMTSIMIATPQFWRLALADNPKHFIGYLVWEGDKVPEYWIPHLLDERVDQIWVPSQHTKDAILKTFFETNPKEGKISKDHILVNKIKIVPHGVDLNIFKPNSQEPLIGNEKDGLNSQHPPDTFKFICNKGWRGGWEDRGGVAYVLKAFCEEFNKDEPVELILKLNPTYINPEIVQAELDKLNLPENRPPIKLNYSIVPYKNLSEFYNQGNVYMCAQRADAFNLCGIEAMGCGLPTIQTGFGGQTEYMNEKNGWLIDYKLEEVKSDIMYEGCKWAIPDVTHLKKIMREVYENKEKTKEKGNQSLKDVQTWTWRNSAKKALEFLNELNQ